MHPHDPSSDATSEDDENDVDQDILRIEPGAVHGKKSLLLQTPVTSPIPQGPQIHPWDVLMRNVRKWFHQCRHHIINFWVVGCG